ncbi:Probable receptor-like protein kinase At5g59700 [Linum grandiflorum]
MLMPRCSSEGFVPTDNYLINCGSETDTTVSNRVFVADKSDSTFLSTRNHITANYTNCTQQDDSVLLYQTARIFDQKSTYKFPIKQQGRHFIRLYFHPFVYSNYNMFQASFDVSTTNHSLLSNFSVNSSTSTLVKEFSLNLASSSSLAITFVPFANSFAYVNALEVVSVPDYLIKEGTSTPDQMAGFQGMASQSLETSYRVNMGGLMLNYANDTLWRTWVPDRAYQVDPSTTRTLTNVSAVHYGTGDRSVTEEIAQKSIYGTATENTNYNSYGNNINNVSWEFDVDAGYQYFIRFHFCDIRPNDTSNSAYPESRRLVFDVSINSVVAIKGYDISSVTGGVAGGADYRDMVTPLISSRTLRVSISPSGNDSSSGYFSSDALLNGLEIMKMNNSLGSLSGAAAVSPDYKNGGCGSGLRFGSVVAGVVSILVALLVA